ncbi:MAG TPA: TIGR02281 family clan AA aspartic protease [Myxococcota bacterium]|nr:TIGR02281 family clan AA aspartic protease [Myxococcota bacterium]
MRRSAAPILASLVLLAAPAGAEIYRWTDAEGRVHFTQDLSQVPPAQRAAAEQGDGTGAGRLQTFEGRADAPAPPAAAADSSPARTAYRVPVQRAGAGMLVVARVNGAYAVPFLIDTGATDVLIPASIARQIGLEPGPDARTKRYATANGVVEHAVVMLDSIDLGGAVARDVPASIGNDMEFGLLGLSYFNRFSTHVDAAAGVVTLVPNGLLESGAIRGGRSEEQWRSEYAGLHARIEYLEAEATRTPRSHGREIERLAAAREELARQLELLDAEADRARVPFPWRNPR